MKRRLDPAITYLMRLLQIVAGVALFGMIGLTLADVLCRHILGFSISGVVDGVEFLFVWMIFPAIAVAFFVGAHISVDIIDMSLPPKARTLLTVVNGLVAIVVLGWLCWLAVVEFLDKLDWGDRTIDLNIPLTWFWAAVIIGFGLSVIGLLVQVFNSNRQD